MGEELKAFEVDRKREWASEANVGRKVVDLIPEKNILQHIRQPNRWGIHHTPSSFYLVVAKFGATVNYLRSTVPALKSNHGAQR